MLEFKEFESKENSENGQEIVHVQERELREMKRDGTSNKYFFVYNLLFCMQGDVVFYSNLSSFLVDVVGDSDAQSQHLNCKCTRGRSELPCRTPVYHEQDHMSGEGTTVHLLHWL